MKQEMLKERVELLAIGEALGWPRLGIGHPINGKKQSIRAGQEGWERFAAQAHTSRIPAALRIGRVLRDNGVQPFHPLSGAEIAPPMYMTPQGPAITVNPAPDLLDEITPAERDKTAPRETWVKAGTVRVYKEGKRRKYPVKKNKAKVPDAPA